MHFAKPLITGKLVKRYKRFLADVILGNGEETTAHCANSGSLLGLATSGMRVWLSESDNAARKLKYTWELVEDQGHLVGVNTSHPNALVARAISEGVIAPLQGYSHLKREVKYGENSRIDILLSAANQPNCYVEVKNVTMRREGAAVFPDAVTARGTKHLQEMTKLMHQGVRAAMVYVVQRDDCQTFCLAGDIDPVYAKAAAEAFAAGVEVYVYACRISASAIKLYRPLPISL